MPKAKNGVHQLVLHQKGDKRLMIQFRFNLNVRDELEGRLADDCGVLQRRRQFRPTMVKALRLFFDLTLGYTMVLRELFPEVVREIETSFQSTEIEALRREIAELKQQGYRLPKRSETAPPKEAKIVMTEVSSNVAMRNLMNNIGGFFD